MTTTDQITYEISEIISRSPLRSSPIEVKSDTTGTRIVMSTDRHDSAYTAINIALCHHDVMSRSLWQHGYIIDTPQISPDGSICWAVTEDQTHPRHNEDTHDDLSSVADMLERAANVCRNHGTPSNTPMLEGELIDATKWSQHIRAVADKLTRMPSPRDNPKK